MSSGWITHQHGHVGSAIHRLPAPVKLGLALAVIVGTVIMPASVHAWFYGVAALLAVAVMASGLAPTFLLKRILALSPFIAGVALAGVFAPSGRVSWRAVAVKSGLCLLTVTIVSNTTPFSKILQVLRRLRVPALLITTIALMHRYLFILSEEAERMRRARLSRTFTRGRRFRWKALSTVLGQLFVRASERSERIYDAMCARGWK